MSCTSPCLDLLLLPTLPTTDQCRRADNISYTSTDSMDFHDFYSTNYHSQYTENPMIRLCNDQQEEHLSTIVSKLESFVIVFNTDDLACHDHDSIVDVAAFTSITPSKTPTN